MAKSEDLRMAAVKHYLGSGDTLAETGKIFGVSATSVERRMLVFWYDDHGEFAEDVAEIKLSGAEIFYLQPDNQFYAKYFLEYANPATNYLIYAPFPRPRPEDNHALHVTMDFIQAEPVGDSVKTATYRIFFASQDGRKISSENIHIADSREKEAQKRIFSLSFTFKNERYDKKKQHYLVAVAEDGGEALRHPALMDIAALGSASS